MGNNDSSGDTVELMDVLNLSTCKCQENKTVNPKLVRTWCLHHIHEKNAWVTFLPGVLLSFVLVADISQTSQLC